MRVIAMSEFSKRQVTADNYFAMIPEWVLYAPISPNAKVTYAVLHRYANSQGICYPSRGTLAKRLDISVRAIDRALDELQDIDALTIQRRKAPDGGWTSSLYHLVTSNPNPIFGPRDAVDPVPPMDLPSDAGDTTPSAENDIGNRTSSNQSQEPYNSPLVSDETRFDEFWAIYPKRVGKGQARKVWKRLARDMDLESIIEGAKRYAARREGQDPQYTAHPATWLNGERWTDEPDPEFTPVKTGRDATVDRVKQASLALERERALELNP